MTANHAHTPTTEEVRLDYVMAYTDKMLANQSFDRWLDQVKAVAKAEAYREAQQIVAGDMTIEEQRSRIGADKVDAAYLIQEFDIEIQELQEGHQ